MVTLSNCIKPRLYQVIWDTTKISEICSLNPKLCHTCSVSHPGLPTSSVCPNRTNELPHCAWLLVHWSSTHVLVHFQVLALSSWSPSYEHNPQVFVLIHWSEEKKKRKNVFLSYHTSFWKCLVSRGHYHTKYLLVLTIFILSPLKSLNYKMLLYISLYTFKFKISAKCAKSVGSVSNLIGCSCPLLTIFSYYFIFFFYKSYLK